MLYDIEKDRKLLKLKTESRLRKEDSYGRERWRRRSIKSCAAKYDDEYEEETKRGIMTWVLHLVGW